MDIDSGSESDRDDEAPQVVVLKKGDLTAEEAEQEQKRIETGKEIQEKSITNFFECVESEKKITMVHRRKAFCTFRFLWLGIFMYTCVFGQRKTNERCK